MDDAAQFRCLRLGGTRGVSSVLSIKAASVVRSVVSRTTGSAIGEPSVVDVYLTQAHHTAFDREQVVHSPAAGSYGALLTGLWHMARLDLRVHADVVERTGDDRHRDGSRLGAVRG